MNHYKIHDIPNSVVASLVFLAIMVIGHLLLGVIFLIIYYPIVTIPLLVFIASTRVLIWKWLSK
jgi:hypothetical protein